MNKIQKKINKLTKYAFDYFSADPSFKTLSYGSVRETLREELKNKYTKEQIIKMSIEELWDRFGE